MKTTLSLVMVLLGLITFRVGGAPVPQEPAPADSYELRFLGCEPAPNEPSHSHNGLFVLTWKGQTATQIHGYPSIDRKTMTPSPSFSVHDKSGWKDRGQGCASCSEWVDVQPGQVLNFKMDMAWVELEKAGYPSLKDFDKGRLLIASRVGVMSSADFVLPLYVSGKN